MNALLNAVVVIAPPLIAGGAALGGVALTQRAAARQQARSSQSAADEKIEMVTVELVNAAINLQVAVATQQPQWNSWQPRLMTLGKALLEFTAGRAAGGYTLGAH